jgi:hypothetical protein
MNIPIVVELRWNSEFENNLIVGIRILNQFSVILDDFDLFSLHEPKYMGDGAQHTFVVNMDRVRLFIFCKCVSLMVVKFSARWDHQR